jgi:hypothetical protein
MREYEELRERSASVTRLQHIRSPVAADLVDAEDEADLPHAHFHLEDKGAEAAGDLDQLGDLCEGVGGRYGGERGEKRRGKVDEDV